MTSATFVDSNPFQRTKAQEMTIAIVPKFTGTISVLSSSVMVYMILRSDIKLGTPFRRLIFAMCIIDIIQSGLAILSTWPSPHDTPGIWGALGNRTSCSITGFLFTYVSNVAQLYMCSLCVHYLYFVQYNIRQGTFRRKIEPFLHIIPNFFSLSIAGYLLMTKHINQADVVCWIAPEPYNCINDQDIECSRGEQSYLYRWIFPAALNGIALFIISVIMFKIYAVVKEREKKNKQLFSRRGTTTEDVNNHDVNEVDNDCEYGAGSVFCNSTSGQQPVDIKEKSEVVFSSKKGQGASTTEGMNHQSKSLSNLYSNGKICDPEALSSSDVSNKKDGGDPEILLNSPSSNNAEVVGDSLREQEPVENTVHARPNNDTEQNLKKKKMNLDHRSKEAMKQAFLFTGSFGTCYSFIWVCGALEQLNVEVPFWMRIGLWFFFPLQGFFNIIIFTRPHVAVLRQSDKELTLTQATWKVIKSGGDISRRKAKVLTSSNMKRRSSAVQRRNKLLSKPVGNRRQMNLNLSSIPLHLDSGGEEHCYPTGPASTHSKPISQIKSSAVDEVQSSIGFEEDIDFDNFVTAAEMGQHDYNMTEHEDFVMYGDNDCDIYDDDCLSLDDVENNNSDSDDLSYEKEEKES
jgi:hypothetical protein